MPETIVAGNDHAGLALKQALIQPVREGGWVVEDLGTHAQASVDYPDFAAAVARRVSSGGGTGLLVCGTGVGMAIAANRHPQVRAVVCSDTFSAKMARAHNDANILCLGARVVGAGLAAEILAAFLDTPYEGGRHAVRVAKLSAPTPATDCR